MVYWCGCPFSFPLWNLSGPSGILSLPNRQPAELASGDRGEIGLCTLGGCRATCPDAFASGTDLVGTRAGSESHDLTSPGMSEDRRGDRP